MNLGTIKAAVRLRYDSPTTSRWTDAKLTACANDAQVQIALDVDFPQSTASFTTNVPPAAPVVANVGATGTTTYAYSVVQVANPGGDTAPGPQGTTTTGVAELTTENYNAVTAATVPGTTYRFLRSIGGATPLLLTSFVADADTTTINDQGQYAASAYLAARGNEYQIAELVKILRCYIQLPGGGMQPLVPTDIPTLGGDVDETFDQSSGTIQGLPPYTPQWLAQPTGPFPVQNAPGRARVLASAPWSNTLYGNQRAMYYLRGGYMGILPPPIANYVVVYDYLPKPPVMQQNSDLSIYPDGFKDAIANKMMYYMALADNSTRDVEFMQLYDADVKKLRIAYVDTIQGNKPHSLVPLTRRTGIRAR